MSRGGSQDTRSTERLDLTTLRRVDGLFEQALLLDEAQRDEWLANLRDREAGSVVRHVEELLDAASRESELLEQAGALGRELLDEAQFDAPLPERIDQYRVVREIGRGGMGRVVLAKRDDPELDGRRVALKILRRSSTAGRERFRRERQILAGLAHPNIARLLDGGWAGTGEPYLVVELVEGERIDLYCALRDLSWRHRIELLTKVCSAVEAAHQQLVVHRDIKPANVLVGEDGEPKLLDFGIASLLGPEEPVRDGDRCLGHGLLLTPQYASPEQFRGEEVSTASDIYQLGLLAYEVLTGARPYDVSAEDLESASAVVTRCVPEPVTRRVAVSNGRAVRLPPVDLDAVVATALAKDPATRYGAVSRFREDLEAVLERRPVSVIPSGGAYRFRRFVQRNRSSVLAVAALLLVAVSLTGAFVLRLAQERRAADLAAELARTQAGLARAAREETDAALDVVAGLFESADPLMRSVDREISPEDLLEDGEARLEGELEDSPRLKARIAAVLGRLRDQVGDRARALELHRLAFESAERALRDVDPSLEPLVRSERLRYLVLLAESENLLGDAQAAASRLAAAHKECLDVHGEPHPICGSVDAALSAVSRTVGRPAEALEWAERALRHYPEGSAGNQRGRLRAMERLALAQLELGRYEEAIRSLERVVRGHEENQPASLILSSSLGHLATAQQFRGLQEEALATAEEALAVVRRVAPRSSRESIQRQLTVAQVAMDASVFGRAQDLLDELATTSVLAPDDDRIVRSMQAKLLLETGRAAAALPLFERLLVEYRALLAPGAPRLGVLLSNYGEALVEAGRIEAAWERLHEALTIFEEALGSDHLFVSYPLLSLGRLAAGEGQTGEARRLLRRALRVRLASRTSSSLEEEADEVAEVRRLLAELDSDQGGPVRLERLPSGVAPP